MTASGHYRILKKLASMTAFCAALLIGGAVAAPAQSIAFRQAVATAAAQDKAIAAFYKERDYRPIWTAAKDRPRRRAFIEAASRAWIHALPVARYEADQIRLDFGNIRSDRARGEVEVKTTREFLQYARDIHSGILEPRRLGQEFYVKPPRRDRLEILRAFAKSQPQAFFRALPPSAPEYQRLLKEKARLEKIIASGGWGDKVRAKKLKPNQTRPEVVALRRRLAAMGYETAGTSAEFDLALQGVVQQFQVDHGLNPDGVAGAGTLAALNRSPGSRLRQVVIGLERQRWLNKDLGKRHILVNLADFRAYVVDNGKPTLTTRVVVGKTGRDYRTPEFEDLMTHMIINPSWYVPQSIARREYLPKLKSDPTALNRLGISMTDISGQQVDPTLIDYSNYGPEDFPFDLRQPPGAGNALGKVKFMFPNRFNIYLHDTPSKSLFRRDTRTYSHGCVRVQKPFALAYTLLSLQSSNPKALFQRYLRTGEETRLDLKTPVPIYLVYQTAWITPEGRPNYRMDPYGRDKKVYRALEQAGAVARAARG